jgi:hypothetical protein
VKAIFEMSSKVVKIIDGSGGEINTLAIGNPITADPGHPLQPGFRSAA